MTLIEGCWRRRAVGVLAVALLAASCGDDDDDAASDPPAETGDETETTAADTGDETGATAATSEGGEADTVTTPSDGGSEDGESCNADRAGGEIVSLTGAAASGLDPTLLNGSGARGGDIAAAFYGTVIRYDAATDTYEPHIAESWEPNEDNSEWTLTLRDDVVFGNGDPFTTEDIAAHLEWLSGTSSRAAGMTTMVTDIEIVSDTEMVVTLESPFNFPYMLASEPGWVPNNDLVEERGEDFHSDPAGAGAGPYEFETMSVAAGESLVLTAKDDWWGGEVCIQQIDFRHAPETGTQTDSFLNGEVDGLFVGDQEQAAELDDQGFMAYQVPVGTMGFITMNQGFEGEETVFDDVRIREAMQLAMEYDALYQRLFDGRGPAPTSALMPEDSSLHAGVDGPPYDPERARELVQETIDEGVWDGSFTFLHSTFSEEQRELAVLLEGMWEAVGMDVTLEPADDSAARVIVDRNFEVATLGFGLVPPEPWTTLNGLECDSPRTRSGFCDPEMDEALAGLREAVTLEEKRQAMGEVQEVWNRTYPLTVYRHGTFGYAAQPHLKGLEFGVDYTVHFDNAWVDE